MGKARGRAGGRWRGKGGGKVAAGAGCGKAAAWRLQQAVVKGKARR